MKIGWQSSQGTNDGSLVASLTITINLTETWHRIRSVFLQCSAKILVAGCLVWTPANVLLLRLQKPSDHHVLGRGSEARVRRGQHHYFGFCGAHRLCQCCHQTQQPASVRTGPQITMTTVYATQEMHVWKSDVMFSHQHWLILPK